MAFFQGRPNAPNSSTPSQITWPSQDTDFNPSKSLTSNPTNLAMPPKPVYSSSSYNTPNLSNSWPFNTPNPSMSNTSNSYTFNTPNQSNSHTSNSPNSVSPNVWCCPSCNTRCSKCLSASGNESEGRENEQVSGPSGQVSGFTTEEELEEFVKPQAEVSTEHAELAPPPPDGSQSATLSHTHESAAAQPEPQESILARADAASVSSRTSVDSVHYDDDGDEPTSPPKFDSAPPTEQDDTLPWSRPYRSGCTFSIALVPTR
jgi:hypothetical protein